MEVLHGLSFMKLSMSGVNVCELAFVLEMDVLSTLFNFRPIYHVDGLQKVLAVNVIVTFCF